MQVTAESSSYCDTRTGKYFDPYAILWYTVRDSNEQCRRHRSSKYIRGKGSSMSQEKVERYKEEKANRKKIAQKQKFMNIVRKTVLSLVALALVGWLGYSAYGTYTANQPRSTVEINYDAITEYMSSLS